MKRNLKWCVALGSKLATWRLCDAIIPCAIHNRGPLCQAPLHGWSQGNTVLQLWEGHPTNTQPHAISTTQIHPNLSSRQQQQEFFCKKIPLAPFRKGSEPLHTHRQTDRHSIHPCTEQTVAARTVSEPCSKVTQLASSPLSALREQI